MNTTAPEGLNQGSYLNRFVFTLNNWTQLEYDAMKKFACKWMIIGKETGKEGTPHLQGACIIGKTMRFTAVKKIPGMERAHIERMRGSAESNVDYCSKEDKQPFTKGTLPRPGQRNDLLAVVEQLRNDSIEELCRTDDDFSAMYIKYTKGVTSFSNMLELPRDGPPTVIWIHGDTGTGKTRSAVEYAMELGVPFWISNGTLQWFDGYRGQRVAILDDFRTGHCKFSFLLRVLDRYPFSVPYKGGFTNWTPEVIIVTAPLAPRAMFDLKREGDIKQLERRITHLVSSPVDVITLLSYQLVQLGGGEASVVDLTSGVSGADRGRNSLLTILPLGESDDESSGSATELSFEESSNLKPELKRQHASIDLTQEYESSSEEPASKKQKL